MAYTTKDKVKSLFRDIDIQATGTAIVETELDEFISDADVEIDSKLYPYYVTPITGTESLKIVGMISKYKAAHTVKTVLEAKAELSDKEQEVQINLGKRADMLLNDLLPKWNASAKRWEPAVMILPDAVTKESSPQTSSIFSSSSNTAVITKGGNNW